VINLIKECDVILHNNRVAVVLFDGMKIQIPHSELIKEKAYINFENERYTIISKEDFENAQPFKTKKNTGNKNKDLISVIDNEEQGYNGL
jgi:hypothetical protein